jgi:hypothetical protein
MPSSVICFRVAPVRTEASEGRIASIIRVTKIGEVDTLAILSRLRRNITKEIFQEPHGVTSQKTAFSFC